MRRCCPASDTWTDASGGCGGVGASVVAGAGGMTHLLKPFVGGCKGGGGREGRGGGRQSTEHIAVAARKEDVAEVALTTWHAQGGLEAAVRPSIRMQSPGYERAAWTVTPPPLRTAPPSAPLASAPSAQPSADAAPPSSAPAPESDSALAPASAAPADTVSPPALPPAAAVAAPPQSQVVPEPTPEEEKHPAWRRLAAAANSDAAANATAIANADIADAIQTEDYIRL